MVLSRRDRLTPPPQDKAGEIIIRLRGHEDELPGVNPSPGWSR